MEGVVTQIVRNSHTDGPGLRTVVFLKGCPLRCGWCHNPETQSAEPEIFFDHRRCINCGECISACSENAILKEGHDRLDRTRCNACMECVKICPTTALEQTGVRMDTPGVLAEVKKDAVLYKNSDGGVTFSGGEPLMQQDFLLSLLKGCRAEGIHIAVDTCGAVPWKALERTNPYVSLFLYDIKHTSRKDVSCELVLDNATRLAAAKTRIWLRIPLVPDFNANDDEIENIGSFIRSLKPPPERVHILPFHRYPENKYRMLGRSWGFADVDELTDEEIDGFQKLLSKSSGHMVTIGG